MSLVSDLARAAQVKKLTEVQKRGETMAKRFHKRFGAALSEELGVFAEHGRVCFMYRGRTFQAEVAPGYTHSLWIISCDATTFYEVVTNTTELVGLLTRRAGYDD